MRLRWLFVVFAIALNPGLADAQAVEGPEFFAFAELGPTYTDNAFFTENNELIDGYFAPTYGIQFAGVLHESDKRSLTYYGRLFVNNERHDTFESLEGELAGALLELKYSRGPWKLVGRGYPKWGYSPGFDQLNISLYDYYGILSRRFESDKFSATPKVVLNRLDSSSIASEATAVGCGVDFGYELSETKMLSLNLATTYRVYDQPIQGQDRKDWRHGLYASLDWQLNDTVTTGMGVGFTVNDSSISGLSWNAFDVTPLLTLSMKLGRLRGQNRGD